MENQIICENCKCTHKISEHQQDDPWFSCTECGHEIALTPASKSFGKYRLIAHLATGGMAEIFLATASSLGGFEKLLVIKRILPNLARERNFVDMFLDEARIAARLNHRNVIQIFDLGLIDGQYFIAMEYLAGESLAMVVKNCINSRKKLSYALTAGILMQAAEGLEHAHSMLGKDGQKLNIVHRDISPQNIFVLYDGGVKVVDFGIAKAASKNSHTRTGTLKGKYCYMSPEQVLSKDLDPRSDLFSLGIVMWECLVGRKLFHQESDLELLQAIVKQDAVSPRKVDPEIPEELERIVIKAMARNRNLRYQSAAEFRNDLSNYIKNASTNSDTIAIGEYMQKVFAQRITKKRILAERAMATAWDHDASTVVDISHYIGEHDSSMSNLLQGTKPSNSANANKSKLSQNSQPALVNALTKNISTESRRDAEASNTPSTKPRFSKLPFFATLGVCLTVFVFLASYLFLTPTKMVEPKKAFVPTEEKAIIPLGKSNTKDKSIPHLLDKTKKTSTTENDSPSGEEKKVSLKPLIKAERKKIRPKPIELTQHIIKTRLKSHGAKFQKCADAHLAKLQSKKDVTLVLDFTIGSDGRVQRSKLIPSELESSDFGQCLQNRIRRIRFPRHKEKSVTISFPLTFKAISR